LVYSVLKALSPHFGDYAVFSTDDTNIVIVARKSGALGAMDFDRVFSGSLGEDLSHVGLNSEHDFMVRRLGGKFLVEGYFNQIPVPANSDYYPFLDLNAPRAHFKKELSTFLQSWGLSGLPVLEMIEREPLDPAKVTTNKHNKRIVNFAIASYVYERINFGSSKRAKGLPLPVDLSEVADTLANMATDCAMQENENVWLLLFYDVAFFALPNLNPGQAQALVTAALPDRCLESSSPKIRQLRRFYLAVAGRDALAMHEQGEQLLASEFDFDRSLRDYIMAATLLGYVSSGRGDEAMERWRVWNAGIQKFRLPAYLVAILNIVSQHEKFGLDAA
jgi:spermidine synthase